tara:strand:+ start:532 stop:747 length:216 start_codon:yes stop_codon:yes gene_type:complete
MVGVLFLLRWDFGPSLLIVCKKLFFLINLMPYFVEIAENINEKKYKIKMNKLFMYIEFIKVINEIIVIKIL